MENICSYPKYSVLMSVYYRENAENLMQAIESILQQTIPTDDFVLVCDGDLTPALEGVIAHYKEKIHVIRQSQNKGLACALNKGLRYCKNDLVARMDSDDISLPDRCENQLREFVLNPSLDIISGTIMEFSGTPERILGKRCLPAEHDEICRFSRRRCPFNHPAVMFRKSAVELAGSYKQTYICEDYYLWIRMLQSGAEAANLKVPLLYMRTTDGMYCRRGGWQYAKSIVCFRWWMCQCGWSNFLDFCVSALPQAVICVAPNSVRKAFYSFLHSNRKKLIIKKVFKV